MKTVKIPYHPRNWSKPFHQSNKRWKVVVMHRRGGKTTACINQLIKDAMTTNFSRFAYVAPTYKQAKLVAWDMVKHYSRPIPGVNFNESELRADYPNGSRISLYGAENADGLRGLALWGVVFDEYSQQPSTIFTEVVSKCLADHLGYAIWIGTPKGKNDFYDIFKNSRGNDEWFSHFQDIDQSLKTEEGETIENLRVALEDDKRMVKQGIITEDEFRQEWYCSFDAAIKGAYYGKQMSIASEEGRLGNVPYDSALKVHTYWDLGMADATAIWFVQFFGKEIRLIDYYEASGEALSHYVKVLQDRGYIYGQHTCPHDIEVRELGSGKSRREVLEGLGLYPRTAPKMPVQEGIEAVRRILNRCWFDAKKCDKGIEALRQYHKAYDDVRKQFSSRPFHDWSSHGSDSMRVLAMTFRDSQEKLYVEDEDVDDRYSIL